MIVLECGIGGQPQKKAHQKLEETEKKRPRETKTERAQRGETGTPRPQKVLPEGSTVGSGEPAPAAHDIDVGDIKPTPGLVPEGEAVAQRSHGEGGHVSGASCAHEAGGPFHHVHAGANEPRGLPDDALGRNVWGRA